MGVSPELEIEKKYAAEKTWRVQHILAILYNDSDASYEQKKCHNH